MSLTHLERRRPIKPFAIWLAGFKLDGIQPGVTQSAVYSSPRHMSWLLCVRAWVCARIANSVRRHGPGSSMHNGRNSCGVTPAEAPNAGGVSLS